MLFCEIPIRQRPEYDVQKKVMNNGMNGAMVGIAPATNKVEGKETADPHGIAVVK